MNIRTQRPASLRHTLLRGRRAPRAPQAAERVQGLLRGGPANAPEDKAPSRPGADARGHTPRPGGGELARRRAARGARAPGRAARRARHGGGRMPLAPGARRGLGRPAQHTQPSGPARRGRAAERGSAAALMGAGLQEARPLAAVVRPLRGYVHMDAAYRRSPGVCLPAEPERGWAHL